MYKYNMILSNSDQNKDKELQLINTMLEKQVDGIVFMGGNITEEHVEQFSTASVPVVLAATYDGSGKIPSVNIDYEEAAFEATELLMNKGHKQPAFIYGQDHIESNNLKFAGYKRALKAANLEVNEDYIVDKSYSYEAGINAVNQLLSLSEPPTAVFVASDDMDLGGIPGDRKSAV